MNGVQLDKTQLKEKVLQFLYANKRNRSLLNQLSKKLETHDYDQGELMEMILQQGEHETLSSVEVILLSKYLTDMKATKDSELNLNPLQAFSALEVNSAMSYVKPAMEKKTLPIMLNNVLQVGYEDYLTTIHIKDLYELYSSSLISYNFETQRDPKYYKDQSGEVVKKANINRKSVEDITKLLLEKSYIPDIITLNLSVGTAENGEELTYNAKTSELTINKGTSIDILDGFHRLSAIAKAMAINSDLDIVFPLQIKNYEARKARRFVGQTNTVNVMPKQYVKQLKMDTHSDYIVSELIAHSELKDRVSPRGKISSVVSRHITSLHKLTEAIDTMFNAQSKREARKIISYLTKYFDELVGLYIEEDIPYESSIFSAPDAMKAIISHAKEKYDNGEMVEFELENILLNKDEEDSVDAIIKKLES